MVGALHMLGADDVGGVSFRDVARGALKVGRLGNVAGGKIVDVFVPGGGKKLAGYVEKGYSAGEKKIDPKKSPASPAASGEAEKTPSTVPRKRSWSWVVAAVAAVAVGGVVTAALVRS